MRTRALFLLLALAVAPRVGAQAVRGVVIAADSTLVPGVIVTLVDSTGRPVARALTDDGGQYSLRGPTSGTYRIEAKRLAFRPTLDVPVVLESGKVLRHDLMVTGSAVPLDAVRVTAEQVCETNPSPTSNAFAVWEEARKALRSSQLTRLTRAYRVDVTTFVRQQGPTQQVFRTTDSVVKRGLPIRPFTSPPAEQLAEQGYLSRDERGEIYHAPDEDVLLSDSFAATHCLRILPDSGSANNVRLGFAPVPGRRAPDIAGVLTLDRASSELRRLDFSFVNLRPISVAATPGGDITFRRLPDGSWIIDEWAIRLPVPELRAAEVQYSTPAPIVRGQSLIQSPAGTVRYGLKTTGGYVTRVTFGEETLWLRPAGTP